MPGLGQGRDLLETCCCFCDILETEAVEIKHCTSGLLAIWQAGLGQGMLEYWAVIEEEIIFDRFFLLACLA